ncbi:glycosyltransferase family 2 protein [Subtercola sp. PAMC28395]|uniref:glycosyltransferase family 2 protein n=1 Tax=Subtercola sp. PAMC28395 TaxID=2846775 RepID=UPI001C0B8418|nr:glycosyltransferase family 2 protein [Subtercola sp. PAMC28395]QWT25042.1 glycosyltransferase family 2 protein [Subtercola sp. PAMC28395]
MPVVDFVETTEPVCSVIVLAWRLDEPLIDCLRSLAASQDAPAFEVIVVQNGADDAVKDALATTVTGARILDIPENVGFGGGCNAGASLARGEFVVFLNDDTVVDEFWLGALHRGILSDDSAGAVASLLLNPDGSVQEAGSRVLGDRGTVQFGAGMTLDEAAAAGLLERRQIDYGSAAALLVRTELFRRAAGFDPIYEPAYFEDVDLQFRLRSAGDDVVFEPRARVVHLSGGSTSSGIAFRTWAATHSGEIFSERWASTLATAPRKTDALSALCDVPIDDDIVSGGRHLSTAEQIVAGSHVTALTIARAFTSWISVNFDELEAGRVEISRLHHEVQLRNEKIERLETALAGAERENAELTAERDLLAARLGDLDSRGPIGVIKWQAGLFRNRRATN